MMLGSVLMFTACNNGNFSNLQSAVKDIAQTEQGVDVGLKIYDPNGKTQQTQSVENGLKVTVVTPDLSQPLKSPVTIHGKVAGTYFSEGVFPVLLIDSKGNEIARVQAQADGEWMTQDAVPFTAQLTFTTPTDPNAKLVFMKDNESGLPENDFSQSFAVTLQ